MKSATLGGEATHYIGAASAVARGWHAVTGSGGRAGLPESPLEILVVSVFCRRESLIWDHWRPQLRPR
jgi:hypothetical protein